MVSTQSIILWSVTHHSSLGVFIRHVAHLFNTIPYDRTEPFPTGTGEPIGHMHDWRDETIII